MLRVWLAALVPLAVCLLHGQAALAQADIPRSIATFATLTKGVAQSSTIGVARDADWFKVVLRDSNSYQITIQGPAVIRIYDATGAQVASSGTAKNYTWFAPRTGTYFVGAVGEGTKTGAYTLRYVVADNSANTATEARLVLGKPKTGTMRNTGNFDNFGDPNLFPPDEDWFRIVLNAGYYCVSAAINDGFVDTLELMNQNGQRYASDFNPFGFSYSGFPNVDSADLFIQTSGIYFIKILAGPRGFTQNTSYTVSVVNCE